ncbi:MerR family DNA-binding transcriptional regulator, partial [Rhizobium calliandrae]
MSIGEAAKVLGVSITMLRRWEAEGRLVAEHTPGGHRRYDLVKLRPEQFRAAQDATRKTIAYARVSRRTFHCDDCGYETGRDHNAARNLEKLAASSAVSA